MATEKKNELKNVQVEAVGNKIVLPKGMSYDDAIDWLRRKRLEEEKEVNFFDEIPGYPLDALAAFHRALAELYGWIDLKPTPGFWGDTPPIMIPVKVGPEETIHVPYGTLCIPGISGSLTTQITWKPRPMFFLNGATKQKDVNKFRLIAHKTRELLKTGSIYRHKAVKISWEHERTKRNFDFTIDAPKFMDLSVDEAELVFSRDVQAQLDIGLFTPIVHTEACRKKSIPLKRGILLEGPFGVGKTLTALATAKKAIRSGWTFVYLETVLDLSKGIAFARQYAPAVVFAEDIDRVLGTQDRTVKIDEILNCIDGMDSKHHEIITVLTTNDVGSINKAVLRPGRIDVVVSVRPPDAEAAVRLVKLYARGLLSDRVDFGRVGEVLEGKNPAVIREVVERAKIAAIARLGGAEIEGQVAETDIANAATAIEAHVRLLEDGQKPKERRFELRLGGYTETPIPLESPNGEEAKA